MTQYVSYCKDPSHFLFSGFVYCYLQNPFSSYTVNILNVSYYLTIERDLVQVGLMSKDPSSLQDERAQGGTNEHKGSAGGSNEHKGYKRSTGDGTNEHKSEQVQGER